MPTLQALGNLGEFIGAVGVVVSLIYLAQQMNQNTTQVRAASFNSMVQNSMRLLEHVFRNKEFAAFLQRAERDPSSLTPEERLRFDAYMTAVFRHFGNLLYQHKVGALGEQMWQSYRRTLKSDLDNPAWVDWYQGHSHLFSDALTEQVLDVLERKEVEKRVGVGRSASGPEPRSGDSGLPSDETVTPPTGAPTPSRG